MATAYKEIYASFLSKITDYSILTLDQEVLESQLEMYLRSSIPKFRRPRVDLKSTIELQDDSGFSLKYFEDDLSLMEIEILATLMVCEFFKPITNTEMIYKQSMTDKEFRFYSQANHLAELKDLAKDVWKEAERLIRDYSFEKLGEQNDK